MIGELLRQDGGKAKRKPNTENDSIENSKKVLTRAAIVMVLGTLVCLLLSLILFSRLSADLAALTLLGCLLLLIWPAVVLTHSATKIARFQRTTDYAELYMLRTVIDSLPDHIYVKDSQSRFLFGNLKQRQNVTGSRDGDLIGRDDFAFFPVEIAAEFYNDEQEIIHTGKSIVNKPECIVERDGSNRWTLTSKVPFREQDGRIVGIIGIGRDITAQKQREAELMMCRTVINSLPDLIYVKDTNSRFILANRSASEFMTGSPDGDVLGTDDFAFFPRDVAAASHEDEQAILRNQESLVSNSECILDRSGNKRWILTTKVPFRGEDNRITGIIGIGRDISAQKRSEEEAVKARIQAESASRAKSEFLANMSHEIRTPLNGVIGMTDLALDTELTEEQRDYLETVRLSAEALLAVINDILDFSKIEAGKFDIESVDFDLRECIETTLKTLALRAGEKGLELLCDLSPELPEVVRGDPTRLRQILFNLVGNAIKFTSEGQVEVRAETETRDEAGICLHFTVVDTGIGIPQDKQARIFDAFTQADASTTREYGGTGLGLTITSRLAEMMDGKIWVNSEPGKGSQFHFTISLGWGSTQSAQIRTDIPEVALTGIRVLVVDDNQTNRQILDRLLTRWGMRSTCVESAADAIRELAASRSPEDSYQLVLTDMHMPAMDGFGLVEHIRDKLQLPTATVMMLSSAGERGDTARCRKLGLSAHLIKPVRQGELREAILRALDAYLPSGPSATATAAVAKPAIERRAGLRILVAEDNLVNQRLAKHLLEKRGHQVTLVGDGREAVARLEAERYDLVLMDLQMPHLDGLEATRLIREDEKESGKHQPIVALTAHAVKGDEERCLAAGMDGYLSKPIRPLELDSLLQAYGAESRGWRPPNATDRSEENRP